MGANVRQVRFQRLRSVTFISDAVRTFKSEAFFFCGGSGVGKGGKIVLTQGCQYLPYATEAEGSCVLSSSDLFMEGCKQTCHIVVKCESLRALVKAYDVILSMCFFQYLLRKIDTS